MRTRPFLCRQFRQHLGGIEQAAQVCGVAPKSWYFYENNVELPLRHAIKVLAAVSQVLTVSAQDDLDEFLSHITIPAHRGIYRQQEATMLCGACSSPLQILGPGIFHCSRCSGRK